MACENCLHYRACLVNSEYVPTPCCAYEDKAGYRKQVEGEWIAKKEMYKAPSTYHYYCSNCEKNAIYDTFMDYARKTNYCPNCGAHMKGGAE